MSIFTLYSLLLEKGILCVSDDDFEPKTNSRHEGKEKDFPWSRNQTPIVAIHFNEFICFGKTSRHLISTMQKTSYRAERCRGNAFDLYSKTYLRRNLGKKETRL
jgi:hypothetical protein